MLKRNSVREEKLEQAIGVYKQKGYKLFEKGDIYAKFAKEKTITIPKSGILGRERTERAIEETYIGFDMIGRFYYEVDGVRGGEGKGEAWAI
ncbi:hypothetical protein SE17_04545 [Kouleothrix aurantiaca]|uniref:Uncharacterized protein n=1 Tax=Kouleothrix aurantiaca TaxID=186479 RepID=A0A0P9DW52_9CHLR|nr:hypothetical protein SE17_04545 [Kouleothrix aurantiaca]